MRHETKLALQAFVAVFVPVGSIAAMSYGLTWLENNVGLWAALIGFTFAISLIVSVAVWFMERYT